MNYRIGEQRPRRSGGNFVAPNATLIGSVDLGKNASIWFNVVVRADVDTITIGENSNIQDGAVLHVDPGCPLTIGRNVTVGHKAMVHGCTIGDGSMIGINAVVLNGAVIGTGCLIGANALVTENMNIPDHSLVLGSPAKVKRSLNADERKGLIAAASTYVDNGKNYLRCLKEDDWSTT